MQPDRNRSKETTEGSGSVCRTVSIEMQCLAGYVSDITRAITRRPRAVRARVLMHKVNLGLPVSGAPGNPTPSLVVEASRDVNGDERQREKERERSREGET